MALLAGGSADITAAQPELVNGIKPQMSEPEAGQKLELQNGTVSRATEVHEVPDRSGQGEGEVAVLNGEGLQANHAPPDSVQQEAATEPDAGYIYARKGI